MPPVYPAVQTSPSSTSPVPKPNQYNNNNKNNNNNHSDVNALEFKNVVELKNVEY